MLLHAHPSAYMLLSIKNHYTDIELLITTKIHVCLQNEQQIRISNEYSKHLSTHARALAQPFIQIEHKRSYAL